LKNWEAGATGSILLNAGILSNEKKSYIYFLEVFCHHLVPSGFHFQRSASQLLDKVWGYGHDGYEHTVNSHINRLRAKIEKDPAHPVYIGTVWGVGYKFADSESLKESG